MGSPLRFAGLPPFALLAVFSLPVAISLTLTLEKSRSLGILVHTSNFRMRPSPQSLVLRIDQANHWFLDGRRALPDEFYGTLKGALSRRSDWVVYLEVDPDLRFGAAAHAIDAIKGLYAEVVLVRPSAAVRQRQTATEASIAAAFTARPRVP